MRHFAPGLLALVLCAPAVAAPKNAYSESSSSMTAIGVADTSNVSTGQSLSALFSINRNWLQTYMTINGTRGTFVFGLGGIYKFTVAGDTRLGFHIGPGFSIGTVPVAGKSEFAFSLFGMAGGHFTLLDRLILSVDGGPMVNVIDGEADFSLKPMGETLGLGIHYLF